MELFSRLYRATLARLAPGRAGLDPDADDARAELDIGA
jgi:hypothetical protein